MSATFPVYIFNFWRHALGINRSYESVWWTYCILCIKRKKKNKLSSSITIDGFFFLLQKLELWTFNRLLKLLKHIWKIWTDLIELNVWTWCFCWCTECFNVLYLPSAKNWLILLISFVDLPWRWLVDRSWKMNKFH